MAGPMAKKLNVMFSCHGVSIGVYLAVQTIGDRS